MGYSYTSSGRLCCDSCGTSEGARKRPCPFKVDGLSYCQPPALCRTCYDLDKAAGDLHKGHKEAAERAQAFRDAEKLALENGAYLLRTGYGSWHDTVPEGFIGALFFNKTGEQMGFLIPAAEYATRNDNGPIVPELFPGREAWTA